MHCHFWSVGSTTDVRHCAWSYFFLKAWIHPPYYTIIYYYFARNKGHEMTYYRGISATVHKYFRLFQFIFSQSLSNRLKRFVAVNWGIVRQFQCRQMVPWDFITILVSMLTVVEFSRAGSRRFKYKAFT